MADQEHASESESGLKRSLGLSGLTFYGVGTVLGAGIFVVVGEVVAEAGALSPLAYIFAGLVALTTALSFAELGARIPTAGGPIDYVEQAFGVSWLANLTGWALAIANIVSGATITTGFVSYLSAFIDVPFWMAATGLLLLLGVISIAGIKQSAWFMTVTTVIGLITLVVVIWARRDAVMSAPAEMTEAFGQLDATMLAGLYAGAFLAFYSFIGFGDMAQTAEETRDVSRTLPWAIVLTLVTVFVFYVLISAALIGGEPVDWKAAEAPVVRAAEIEGYPALPIGVASLLVIVNGGLTQIVTAARLLLDLGRDGRGAPGWLGRVNPRTSTPVPATLLVLAVVLALTLAVPLAGLANATSLVVLVVFVAVNAALWRLKTQGQPDGPPDIPIVIPIAGVILSTLAAAGQIALWAGVVST
ncbi:MAG: amino acid permease [Oceanicaulis sp.]